MEQGAAQDPIKLALGQTAEPGRCGSCVFFERLRGEDPRKFGSSEFESAYFELRGYCNIILPPWLQKKPYDGNSMPPETIKDTDGCNLHRHTGKAYITSKVVRP